MEKVTQLREIEITKINPSPRNPRKTFNETDLAELAQNIKNQGLLQPITVRPVGKTFEIVCGERRYRAVKMNAEESKKKRAYITCIVKDLTDDEAYEAMITENLQRKDVDPIEEAFAFGELIKAGKTVDEIAARFGKNKRFIQERCKLNTLVTPLKDLTTQGIIPIAGAIMLAKLEEERQVKYQENIKARYGETPDANRSISITEIKNWIDREFMNLQYAPFLDYDDDEDDDDDEEKEPVAKEDWNTGSFEKCATCLMNTANAGCLFYSMNGDPRCTDRKCFERKTAAYYFSEIEEKSDRIIKEGENIEPGKVAIIYDGKETSNYGYENVKNCRKLLLEMIKMKGYKIMSSDAFDGMCKYYNGDERIPKLLKEEKIIECFTLGDEWRLDACTRYFYLKGNAGLEPGEDKAAMEARELTIKYNSIRSKVESSVKEELQRWCKEKQYSARGGALDSTEECYFWSFIVMNSTEDIIEESGATKFWNHEKILPYVKNNMTEENKLRWQRSFMCAMFLKTSYSEKLTENGMSECLRLAYPDEFRELKKKYAEQLDKKTEKIRLRLEELGYNSEGKKITGESK